MQGENRVFKQCREETEFFLTVQGTNRFFQQCRAETEFSNSVFKQCKAEAEFSSNEDAETEFFNSAGQNKIVYICAEHVEKFPRKKSGKQGFLAAKAGVSTKLGWKTGFSRRAERKQGVSTSAGQKTWFSSCTDQSRGFTLYQCRVKIRIF